MMSSRNEICKCNPIKTKINFVKFLCFKVTKNNILWTCCDKLSTRVLALRKIIA